MSARCVKEWFGASPRTWLCTCIGGAFPRMWVCIGSAFSQHVGVHRRGISQDVGMQRRRAAVTNAKQASKSHRKACSSARRDKLSVVCVCVEGGLHAVVLHHAITVPHPLPPEAAAASAAQPLCQGFALSNAGPGACTVLYIINMSLVDQPRSVYLTVEHAAISNAVVNNFAIEPC